MFVTLTVAEQLCGIPVMQVRDVLRGQSINRVPLAPPEVAGNLNLRGRIVIAIDLRRRLGLPSQPAGAAAMAIVVEHDREFCALLVDQVCEVLSLEGCRFEPVPATVSPDWARFSSGIYRLADGLMLMLDLARLLDFTAAEC